MNTVSKICGTVKTGDVREALGRMPINSAWDRGVHAQALDMLYNMRDDDLIPMQSKDLLPLLLNGARDWKQYSHGGCALACNVDIAERYLCPSQLTRYMAPGHEASEAPGGEDLMDMQERACRLAFRLIVNAAHQAHDESAE